MTRQPTVAVVGAGVAGLGMAKKLKDAGVPFTVFEKADRVGGTWRENTYPGLTCDVPAMVYTYSFDRNPGWPRILATGAEIQRYVEAVCDRHGLSERIRFGAEVTDAEWLGDRWRLRTGDGEEREFDAVVQATGFLHRPRVPDIPGLEDFGGAAFHSARWDHDVGLPGKRVGVVGTGSTGVQLVGALPGTAAKVSLFQRTPQWVFPFPNTRMPGQLRRLLERSPGLTQRLVDGMERAGDWLLGGAAIHGGRRRRFFGWACRRYLATVEDPDLRRRLTPDYEPLCKRPVMSARFYGAMQRADVELVDSAIDHVEAEGVVTADGRLHPLDVLVLATGFDSHAYMRPMRVVGQDGATLENAWTGGPSGYRTMALPGFPNMFMILGPHSPLVHIAIHSSVELQADYVIQMLERLREPDVVSLTPTEEATQTWLDEVRAGLPGTVWASGCSSWYVGPDGLPVLWPFSRRRWFEMLRSPDFGDYEVRLRSPAPAAGPVA
jgi:cation diffusion facilitator CzcD-associated flavoprotein CzcO